MSDAVSGALAWLWLLGVFFGLGGLIGAAAHTMVLRHRRRSRTMKMEVSVTRWHGEAVTLFYVCEFPAGEPDAWEVVATFHTAEEARAFAAERAAVLA